MKSTDELKSTELKILESALKIALLAAFEGWRENRAIRAELLRIAELALKSPIPQLREKGEALKKVVASNNR